MQHLACRSLLGNQHPSSVFHPTSRRLPRTNQISSNAFRVWLRQQSPDSSDTDNRLFPHSLRPAHPFTARLLEFHSAQQTLRPRASLHIWDLLEHRHCLPCLLTSMANPQLFLLGLLCWLQALTASSEAMLPTSSFKPVTACGVRAETLPKQPGWPTCLTRSTARAGLRLL